MAKQLSKSGIVTGQTIKASEVSQSIDALTGTEAYDITISGSLTITGSTSIDGDVFLNPTSATTGTSVLTINPTTGKIFRTGSYSSGGSGPTPNLGAVTTAGNTTTNAITTGNITSTGQISASGNLFAGVADNNNSSFKVVVYDTSTGRFYRTGSFSSVLVSSGSKFNFGTDEIVYDDGNGGEGVGIKGTGSKTVEITDKDGNGGKLDVGGGDGNGEIMIGDSGDIRGGEGKGKLTPGLGDGEWEIEKEDGSGGKLNVGGNDGDGTLVIGKGGAIQGDTGKGKISPVIDNNIQEDGHFQVLKNDGTKGQISTNIKAGTNTTIIDDNIVLSEPTGYIVATGSITTLSNFIGGGLELTPSAGGNGGNITVTNVGGGGTGLVHINASGSITASGNISASGNLIAKKIIVDAEGSDPGNLDIQVGSPGIGIASIPAGNQIGLYTSNSYRLVAKNSEVEISTNLDVVGDTIIRGDLNLSGSTPSNITASGAISASGNIFGNRIVAETYLSASSLDIGAGGNVEIDSIAIRIPNLPTSDPGVAGRLWRDGTDLKISV